MLQYTSEHETRREDVTLDPLSQGIVRGREFLAGALERSGGILWRDYVAQDGSGGSNEWVSGFVGAQLGAIEETRELAAGAVHALFGRARSSGGWGFRELVLEDCDSTAWVLLAAARARVPVPRALAESSLRFILSHQTAAGGFTTYTPQAREQFGFGVQRSGWFEAQTCVTAAALLSLAEAGFGETEEARHAARFLAEHVDQCGLWKAYWWKGAGYATHLALAALAKVEAQSAPRAELATESLLSLQCVDGGWGAEKGAPSTAFQTALALLAIVPFQSGSGIEQRIAAGVSCLLSLQREDGGFVPSADVFVPGGSNGNPMTLHDRGVFTTACALNALDVVRAWRAQTS